METKSAEETELNNAVNELKALNEKLEQTLAARKQKANGMTFKEKEEDLERMRKSMAQQLADFEVMKKALMRDLQNRCEKVVELEISLDETREQYNNVLRASNNKAQQKKMSVLERNLEQLTNVQKQASKKKKLHLLYKSSVCLTLFIVCSLWNRIRSSKRKLHWQIANLQLVTSVSRTWKCSFKKRSSVC